jgi:outer membrane murein-binding lipoprotein Lpp
MPRQLDQLPSDPTTLARKIAALERQVKELRAPAA